MEQLAYRNKHLAGAARLFAGAFAAPPLGYGFITPAGSERYLRDISKKPGFMGFVYYSGGGMVAFVFGTLDGYHGPGVFAIEEFAVDARLHRGGHGSAALRMLEETLAAKGVAAISLHTSRKLPAYGFYTKNGYSEVADSVSLAKSLSGDWSAGAGASGEIQTN